MANRSVSKIRATVLCVITLRAQMSFITFIWWSLAEGLGQVFLPLTSALVLGFGWNSPRENLVIQ